MAVLQKIASKVKIMLAVCLAAAAFSPAPLLSQRAVTGRAQGISMQMTKMVRAPHAVSRGAAPQQAFRQRASIHSGTCRLPRRLPHHTRAALRSLPACI